jgi:hypothetical protein
MLEKSVFFWLVTSMSTLRGGGGSGLGAWGGMAEGLSCLLTQVRTFRTTCVNFIMVTVSNLFLAIVIHTICKLKIKYMY